MFDSNEPQFAILVTYMLKVSTDLFTKSNGQGLLFVYIYYVLFLKFCLNRDLINESHVLISIYNVKISFQQLQINLNVSRLELYLKITAI